jgi:hypothetical protein
MKICPLCGNSYSDEAKCCPADGSVLRGSGGETGRGRIEVWAKPKVDMGALNSLDPASTMVVKINDSRYEMSWGRRTFEVQPGEYMVSVCLKSWLVREREDAEFEMVSVRAGETVHVRFTAGVTVFQRGTVTVDGTTRFASSAATPQAARPQRKVVDQYDQHDIPDDRSLSLEDMFQMMEEARQTPPASTASELTMQDLKSGSLASMTLPLPVNASQGLVEEAHGAACELLAITIPALRRCREGESFRFGRQAGGSAQIYFEQLNGTARARIDQLARTYPGLPSFGGYLAKRRVEETKATPSGNLCGACRKPIAANTRFCGLCGQEQRKPAVLRCSQCGAVCASGKFCGQCGGRIA